MFPEITLPHKPIFTDKEKIKFANLSGGYNLDKASDGRLISAIFDPFELYPSLGTRVKKKYAKKIEAKVSDNLRVGYNFVASILYNALEIDIPNMADSSFKYLSTYEDVLNEISSIPMSYIPSHEKNYLKQTGRDNLVYIRKGRFKDEFEEVLNENVFLKTNTFDPRDMGGLVRLSIKIMKDKHRLVEKVVNRHWRLHKEFASEDSRYIQHLMRNNNLSLKESRTMSLTSIKDYVNSVIRSGKDLYDYIDKNNPKNVPINLIHSFKDSSYSLFPTDYTGIKVILESREAVKNLVENHVNKKRHKINNFTILRTHYENNIESSSKDHSLTITVGDKADEDSTCEIKFCSLADEMENEFGDRNHPKYTLNSRKTLLKLLNGKLSPYYSPMYENGTNAFSIDPILQK